MYAQVLIEGHDARTCGELDDAIRERLLPELRVQEGFSGALHLVSRHDGEAMLLSSGRPRNRRRWPRRCRSSLRLAPAGGGSTGRASIWEVTQRA